MLTLAIGLGANTAVFTLVHALILRTLGTAIVALMASAVVAAALPARRAAATNPSTVLRGE